MACKCKASRVRALHGYEFVCTFGRKNCMHTCERERHPLFLPPCGLMRKESDASHALIGLLLRDDGNHAPPAGVLDLRSGAFDASANRLTIRGALCVNGIDGLATCFSWLPPRTAVKDRKGDAKLIRPARRLIVVCQDLEQESKARYALRKWDVAGFVLGEDVDAEFWHLAKHANLIIEESKNEPDILFEPSNMARLLFNEAAATLYSGTARRSISLLDLGCGAGRDMAWIVHEANKFIAAHSYRQWNVSGIDNVASVVQRAKALAAGYRPLDSDSNDVSTIESIVCAQATKEGSLQAMKNAKDNHTSTIDDQLQNSITLYDFARMHLPRTTFDILLLVRFYPKELMITLPELAHVGTLVAVAHFTTFVTEEDDSITQDQKNVDKTYSDPTADKRFERKDVARLLDTWNGQQMLEQRWTVVHHSVHPCEDGRPLRHVLYQRIL